MTAERLRALVQHADPGLTDSHTLHTLTVISSSKIRQKVEHVLRLLSWDHNSDIPAQDAQDGIQYIDRNKPVIVALVATSTVASKLITITEIAKREVDAQQGKKKRTGAKSDEEKVAAGSGSVKAATFVATNELLTYCVLDGIDAPLIPTKGKLGREAEVPKASTAVKFDTKSAVKDDDEIGEDDAFETLATSAAVANVGKAHENTVYEGRERHQTPVLLIYLSMQPVPMLEERYG